MIDDFMIILSSVMFGNSKQKFSIIILVIDGDMSV